MNDKSRRPLQIPSWHIPYMEKHRLYELFHELARELTIQQPEDHVSFIKQILFNTYQNRDNTRVVMICPPRTNCDKVALRISSTTRQVVITKDTLEKFAKAAKSTLKPSQVARVISKLVRKDDAYKNGWILVNCLKNEAEAKALIKAGILPTHCLFLVSPFYPPIDQLKYCDVPEDWPEDRRQLLALKNIFKNILHEVHLKQMSPDEVAKTCIELMKIRGGKISITPRVLIIGPRGSGRKTQAKLLAKTLNIVHIDFEYLLCQAWVSESDISAKLRACKERVCFHSDLLVQLLNKKILEVDCLKNGWVLTGFPFSKADLMYLDCVDTPPNRIIFLECDLKVCRERVTLNRINIDTGSGVNLLDKERVKGKKLELHPKDRENIVNSEHTYYCEKYPQLRDYCGGTASVVNGDQQRRWVNECMIGIIVRESPPCPPRKPFEDEPMPARPPKLEDMFALCKCGPYPPQMKDMFITTL
ncbi:adenylate kinase 8 [Harmonia axyridis]|uniref:adenylate kinase 8 n=1 Tax=Harmonia axyridis TaxID=115357 RepID=UPI001E277685|nr:adenylate kinase 8 [Harmonia axyridis]